MSAFFQSQEYTPLEEEENVTSLEPVLKSLKSKATGLNYAGVHHDRRFVRVSERAFMYGNSETLWFDDMIALRLPDRCRIQPTTKKMNVSRKQILNSRTVEKKEKDQK
ncbi:hypothetical protein COOONC_17972 [Cooperia oncophora]